MSAQRVIVQLKITAKAVDGCQYSSKSEMQIGTKLKNKPRCNKFGHRSEPRSNSSDTNLAEIPPCACLKVLNSTTLQLNIKSSPGRKSKRTTRVHQLQFDNVINLYDLHANAELDGLVDKLVLDKCHCCLVQFCSEREFDVSFLKNVLIKSVGKRMKQLRAILHNIKLEYSDITEFGLVDMLKGVVSLQKGPKALRRHILFNSEEGLSKWLNSEYAHLWGVGQGHEHMQLLYTFSDTRRRTHKVKFSIILVHCNRLDTDGKASLCTFLGNLGTEYQKYFNKEDLQLMDCLHGYLIGPEKWHTSLMFDLPMIKMGEVYMDGMLNLATAAYAGVQALKPTTKAATPTPTTQNPGPSSPSSNPVPGAKKFLHLGGVGLDHLCWPSLMSSGENETSSTRTVSKIE